MSLRERRQEKGGGGREREEEGKMGDRRGERRETEVGRWEESPPFHPLIHTIYISHLENKYQSDTGVLKVW